ncbi:hypothetical protein O1L55_00680 [Streptomyces albulus]|nr:hypothetical protein [Streptomyces noursei]
MAHSLAMDISAAHLRALRAALFAALCVTLSSASHVLLSRMPLPPVTVVATGAAVFVLAYALAGRERGYWRIAGLLLPWSSPPTRSSASASTPVTARTGHWPRPCTHWARCCSAAAARSAARWPSWSARTAPGLRLAAAARRAPRVGLLAAGWLRRGEAAVVRLLGAVAGFAFRPLLIAAAVLGRAAAPRRPVPAPCGPGRPSAPPPARALRGAPRSAVRARRLTAPSARRPAYARPRGYAASRHAPRPTDHETHGAEQS